MELVALAKSKPGEMSYASAGIGTQHHVNAELLKTLTGISITHVPYRGGGPALQDVVAGHVPIYFGDVSTVMTLARTGKVRALALTISQRLETWRDSDDAGLASPTTMRALGEAFVAPAHTPTAIVTRLNRALVEIVNAPETQKRFHELGLRPLTSTPGSWHLYEERSRALGQGCGSRWQRELSDAAPHQTLYKDQKGRTLMSKDATIGLVVPFAQDRLPDEGLQMYRHAVHSARRRVRC
jgi:tripartite-type tricarboxylate transporter receptor subunit TctC